MTVRFRVSNVYRNAAIEVSCNGQVLKSQKKQVLAPGEMEQVILKKSELEGTEGLEEITDPRRIVTSLVRVMGGELPVVSVKTTADIPKDKIGDCIKELKGIELKAPVHMGDVVAENVCGTGVNIVATANVYVV